MSRINIEESLFRDQRWINLLIKTGCQYKAMGLLASAWILAQQNWLKFGYVPKKAWPKDLDILIDVELAIVQEDGNIYVKGSKRSCSWLEQRVEAGRKGGLVKSANYSANVDKNSLAAASGSLAEASGSLANSSKTKPLPLPLPLPLKDNLISSSNVKTTTDLSLLNNSTSNYNARFLPNAQKFKDLLDNYNILKQTERYIGQVINYFETPEKLGAWLHIIDTSEALKKITKREQSQQITDLEIQKYVIVSLKKEIGVLS